MNNTTRDSTKTHAVTDCNGIQKELNYLHDTDGLSWGQIAKLPRFSPIPKRTLYKIASTGTVPKKWRKKLNVVATLDNPRIAISKVDMHSASRSIKNNIPPEKVKRLVLLLAD